MSTPDSTDVLEDKNTIATTVSEPSNVYAEGDTWAYNDPDTGVKYIHKDNQWVEAEKVEDGQEAPSTDASKQAQHMQFLGTTWVYRDPDTKQFAYYDSEKKDWLRYLDDANEDEKSSSESEEEVEEGEAKDEEEQQEDDFEFQLKQEAKEKRRMEKLRRNAIKVVHGKITYKDAVDNSCYEWSEEKHEWQHVVDDDFIAQYQSNYGCAETIELQKKVPVPEKKVNKNAKKEEEDDELAKMDPEERKEAIKQRKKEKRKLAAEQEKNRGWFEIEEGHNTNVYVSNLPLDITDTEFEEMMKKCGIIALEPLTNKIKIKLYRDQDGNLKGDGRCTFVKKESVDIAMTIVNGSQLRGKEIKVDLAQFQMKGDAYDPAKKRKKMTAKQKKRFKERQEALFDWRPEKLKGERAKSDCTVIISNLFTTEEFDTDPTALLKCRDDLQAECAKHGQLKKVVVYDNNPLGIASVSFATPENSDDCVTMMNFKRFRNRQLAACLWDGKTKYNVKEDEKKVEKRIDNWHQFLEAE